MKNDPLARLRRPIETKAIAADRIVGVRPDKFAKSKRDRAAKELGRTGEEIVAKKYKENGYKILDRNWRVAQGELDIIASKNGTIVFCEVKSRSTIRYGTPLEAVTDEKAARIRRLAAIYLKEKNPKRNNIRFDIGCVTSESVRIVQAAF